VYIKNRETPAGSSLETGLDGAGSAGATGAGTCVVDMGFSKGSRSPVVGETGRKNCGDFSGDFKPELALGASNAQ